MAWRFKASKYKNAVPVEPKLDKQIRDLSIGKFGVQVPLQGLLQGVRCNQVVGEM